jgi:hypothetical protein
MADRVIVGVVLLDLVRDIVSARPAIFGISAEDASVLLFKKECTDLEVDLEELSDIWRQYV